nr:unnamed protein product [Callosobruchus chinensis]
MVNIASQTEEAELQPKPVQPPQPAKPPQPSQPAQLAQLPAPDPGSPTKQQYEFGKSMHDYAKKWTTIRY